MKPPIYLVSYESSDPDGSYTEVEEFASEDEAQTRAVALASPPNPAPRYAGIYRGTSIVYRAEALHEYGYRIRVV